MAKLRFSALLVSIQSKVDRTVKVTLNTQEMGKDAGELMNIAGQQVNVVMVSLDEEIKTEDIPEAPKLDESVVGKSPSQRVRALLYHIWLAKGKPGKSFPLYYDIRMDKITEELGSELDGLN